MSQQGTPEYLIQHIVSLNLQWDRCVKKWDETLRKNPEEYGLSKANTSKKAITSKIDAVSLEGLKKQGRILLGNHQYNASTIVELLRRLSEEPDSVSPPVGETGVLLSDFIKSTIRPVAATGIDDEDQTHIKLFITDNHGHRRVLDQAEINWFFTGHYNPANQTPINGLQDPQRALVSVYELIHIYNVFFKPSQTRRGTEYGDSSYNSSGGKTIKRRKTQRVTKMSHRRFSSKRTTKSKRTRTQRRRTQRRATRTRRN